MEKKYSSLSIFEFQSRFPDEKSCRNYLAELKWKQGFVCKKCSNTTYKLRSSREERKCKKCDHIESPTSGTLFHKVKFPILKAFYIVYYISTSKKGMASTELSRKLGLRQKTCWKFKRKVIKAMTNEEVALLEGSVEIDETFVGGQEQLKKGRGSAKKKQVAIIIEKKGKGISRAYGKVIKNAGTKELRPFIEKHINENAQIQTDKWRGYSPLKTKFGNLTQIKSNKGKNFPVMHRFIMNFKSWLRGIHHSVSNLQDYIDEYIYRFNRHYMQKDIFDNLLLKMVNHDPITYNELLGKASA